MPNQPIQTHIAPDPSQWPAELLPPKSDRLIVARSAFELPTDQPVVASGHQPILFHPGIVAKLIALDLWATKTGSASAWVVPDQDIVDPASIRVPRWKDGTLGVDIVRIADNAQLTGPAQAYPPLVINEEIPEEFESIASWIAGYEHESTLARQITSATIGALCEMLDLNEPTILYASDLIESQAGEWLIDAMLANPIEAAETYNSSVEQFPDAGVRPLSITDSLVELPLWVIDGHQRSPLVVDRNQAAELDRSTLAPRGLIMTAIMRSVLCDLFIHGTGGYEYDKITERWMKQWFGVELAPHAAVSATVTLQLDQEKSIEDPDHAVWLAHHARHNPGMLGDHAAADQKAAILSQMAESKSNGNTQHTAQLYRSLHQLLDTTSQTHSKTLSELDSSAKTARALMRSKEIAQDRTWAFPLYKEEQLLELKHQIQRDFRMVT